MCLTILGQIVYGGLMLCALALTLGGMFTKGWRNTIDPNGHDDGQQGIFQCAPDVTKQSNRDSCEDWLKGLEAWQWVVVVSVVLAAVFQLLALIWTVFSFLSCCCKKHILHPLTGLAAVATIFLIIVVVVFGVKYKDQLNSG
ncbi:CLC-1 protein [Aphelenchoides avenae]|nr:CLC-1 protein [Aphelenchus avenae]